MYSLSINITLTTTNQ